MHAIGLRPNLLKVIIGKICDFFLQCRLYFNSKVKMSKQDQPFQEHILSLHYAALNYLRKFSSKSHFKLKPTYQTESDLNCQKNEKIFTMVCMFKKYGQGFDPISKPFFTMHSKLCMNDYFIKHTYNLMTMNIDVAITTSIFNIKIEYFLLMKDAVF